MYGFVLHDWHSSQPTLGIPDKNGHSPALWDVGRLSHGAFGDRAAGLQVDVDVLDPSQQKPIACLFATYYARM